MKLLYVVHRYYPYPGGSEYFVQAMAEESFRRGQEVSVLTGKHKGNQNGINVTSDLNILRELFDLIVVHGENAPLQSFVLLNADKILSPVVYMLIKPSMSFTSMLAMKKCRYISFSTSFGYRCILRNEYEIKAVRIRHGIDAKQYSGFCGQRFKSKYGIKTTRMFLSASGFWHNKGMLELERAFRAANLNDTIMVFTGYTNFNQFTPSESENIRVLQLGNKQDINNGISEADLYIMNSTEEGFGLVLLESMLNKTPWIARNIAGAHDMRDYGIVYDTYDQLVYHLKTFKPDPPLIEKAYSYVTQNNFISNTLDDIERIKRAETTSSSIR